MNASIRQRHAWANRLQTSLLVVSLLGINALAGMLLLGPDGLWIAFGASLLALLFEPAAGMELTLRLYRAQAIATSAAPGLWQTLAALAQRAGLPHVPALYYVPSPLINAFAVGDRQRAAIALSDGLLRQLNSREVAGVLGHEIAHIAHGDLRVMGLADFVSRLTSLYALAGQVLLLLAMPAWFFGVVDISWFALLLLAASPWLATGAQMGLSRVREFDADLKAGELTGDPMGLASALSKIEHAGRSWRSVLFPGWGNPQPSWLRTHPATEERIERLRQMQMDFTLPRWELAWPATAPTPRHLDAAPRWRVGGHWW